MTDRFCIFPDDDATRLLETAGFVHRVEVGRPGMVDVEAVIAAGALVECEQWIDYVLFNEGNKAIIVAFRDAELAIMFRLAL